MRTQDAMSNHSALVLGTSLIIFVVAYFIVFGIGTRYLLKLVAWGPTSMTIRAMTAPMRRSAGQHGRCPPPRTHRPAPSTTPRKG